MGGGRCPFTGHNNGICTEAVGGDEPGDNLIVLIKSKKARLLLLYFPDLRLDSTSIKNSSKSKSYSKSVGASSNNTPPLLATGRSGDIVLYGLNLILIGVSLFTNGLL